MEHITFGIGAFQVIVTKIVPDQLDHMLTERSPIGFQKHSDNRSDMVLRPPPPPPANSCIVIVSHYVIKGDQPICSDDIKLIFGLGR